MRQEIVRDYVRHQFAYHHRADVAADYDTWRVVADAADLPMAVLGYRGGEEGRLFLESYFDESIEQVLGRHIGTPIGRDRIVELGCLAAAPSAALLKLWAGSAEDLGDRYDYAVATLTLPLRRMFGRIGMPIVELTPARIERLGPKPADWGQYYALDPIVCAGPIGAGAQALAGYFATRTLAA